MAEPNEINRLKMMISQFRVSELTVSFIRCLLTNPIFASLCYNLKIDQKPDESEN